MPVGLFGKLPQKRDFVSLGLPRPVLEPFETWMQSAVAASRHQLGRDWQELYLVSPLWRFWIGAEIFGTACAGVTMPSVDGIGRFFPLTLIGYGTVPVFSLPPTLHAADGWYRGLEDRLLETLGEDATGDPAAILSGLAVPDGSPETTDPEGAGEPGARGRLWKAEATGAAALLETVRNEDYALAAASRSLWWTDGGQASGATVYSCAGLPDPYFYSTMIGSAA